ncbi:MAG: hypothetical protein ACREM1_05215 [Longimicrobiales bacterium]
MSTVEREGALYAELLDGVYDCVDRIVLRAYCRFLQGPGGFRLWWRRWQGSEERLNNKQIMRLAGRFSRRVRAWAEQHGVPVIFAHAGERKDEVAAKHLPKDPAFRGVFLIVAGRAPASVWEVVSTADGRIRKIRRKDPQPWVNHYAFHVWDEEWGHVIFRFCPHPPYNALVIVNGHEWVAREAERRGLVFQKEDNCFTEWSNAAGLEQIAETSSAESSKGRLFRVCERWMYSAVLCFMVETADQERTNFRYSYSIYQAEYSRNLLFRSGAEMDQVFQRLIDRVRGPLQLRTVCHLFGRRRRPRRKKGDRREPALDVVLERPEYDLTILRVHFARLTLKIYTKGERVLRIEAMAHNVPDLLCGNSLDRYPLLADELRGMVEVIDCVVSAFIDPGLLDTLSAPSQVGRARVGGVDVVNQAACMRWSRVCSRSPCGPRAFAHPMWPSAWRAQRGDPAYRAAYDLRKLCGKGLVSKPLRSRRYQPCPQALRAPVALLGPARTCDPAAPRKDPPQQRNQSRAGRARSAIPGASHYHETSSAARPVSQRE